MKNFGRRTIACWKEIQDIIIIRDWEFERLFVTLLTIRFMYIFRPILNGLYRWYFFSSCIFTWFFRVHFLLFLILFFLCLLLMIAWINVHTLHRRFVKVIFVRLIIWLSSKIIRWNRKIKICFFWGNNAFVNEFE